MTASDDPPSISRRELMATLAAASSAGCLQRARSLVNRQSRNGISVTIKTVPADNDEASVKIARRLEKRLHAVGIDTTIELESEPAFLRDILLNNDFDLYVSQFPAHWDPDFLRATLHSMYVSEPGWQNPFGFSDLELDEILASQRTTDSQTRPTTVDNLAKSVARKQPFSTICFPDVTNAVRTDRFENWPDGGELKSLDLLSLRRLEGTSESDDTVRCRLVHTDARITENLNPIAVEYRRQGAITGLLYDSLLRRADGDLRPWLGTNLEWTETETNTTATVTLREGRTWHDGEALTADDVAFTYRLFNDTTLGAGDVAVPAPRFRGRSSLVESVSAIDNRTVRLSFGLTSRSVAERALTLPILPAHLWKQKTDIAELAGVNVSSSITEALVWPNDQPVGNGPFKFESRTGGEELRLVAFEDHFLNQDPPPWLAHAPAFDELVVQVAPSDASALALVADGTVDATGTPIGPEASNGITGVENVDLRTGSSRSFYHVGFNARRNPFGNVRFRRLVSRLLDPSAIAKTVFDGEATPAATPLSGTKWVPDELRWNGSDPIVPFLGSGGELNVSSAKDAFREVGFKYNDNDRLVR